MSPSGKTSGLFGKASGLSNSKGSIYLGEPLTDDDDDDDECSVGPLVPIVAPPKATKSVPPLASRKHCTSPMDRSSPTTTKLWLCEDGAGQVLLSGTFSDEDEDGDVKEPEAVRVGGDEDGDEHEWEEEGNHEYQRRINVMMEEKRCYARVAIRRQARRSLHTPLVRDIGVQWVRKQHRHSFADCVAVLSDH
jgi:hypothetical protein